MKKIVNSNIEIVRIIAMLMIVLSHTVLHNDFQVNYSLTLNNVFTQVAILGNLGVDLFLLITGYNYAGKEVTKKGAIKVAAQTWFYSWLILILMLLISAFDRDFSVNIIEIVNSCVPIISGQYWFITAYLVFLAVIPLLNNAINVLNRDYLKKIILTLFVLWSVIPTFTSFKMCADQIPQFILFYLIGAYVKLYPNNWITKKRA